MPRLASIGFAVFVVLSPVAMRASTQQRLPLQISTADLVAVAMPATATVFALGPAGDTIRQGSAFVIRPTAF